MKYHTANHYKLQVKLQILEKLLWLAYTACGLQAGGSPCTGLVSCFSAAHSFLPIHINFQLPIIRYNILNIHPLCRRKNKMDALIKEIYDAVINGQQGPASAKVKEALDKGMDPALVLNEGMVAAMAEVGRLFEEGEYFVPEMLISARAMQAGMALLKPRLVQADVKSKGKVVAGTVKGDLHDIGKNLVCMMLEGASFEIVDLGTDVSPDKFVEAVKNTGANVLAMSALLTTTMPNMKNTIEALKSAGLRDRVKVMVGGAPLTTEYAEKIGADGYAPDASRAVALAKTLV
jgi:5-methyltetrahydrofolate--homocysteine methyltransferase